MSHEHRPPSLRRTLLVGLLGPLVVLVPLAAALIYALARQPALQALDHALADVAVALAQLVEQHDDGRVALPLSEQTARALRTDPVDQIEFAAADGQGRLLAGSAALLQRIPAVTAGDWRYDDLEFNGRPWRVAALGLRCSDEPAAAPCVVAVAETLGKRQTAARTALLAAAVGAAALAVPLVVSALWAVRRGLRPVGRAARAVDALDLDRLDELEVQALPRELTGYARAVNHLLGRLREAAAAQRAFVADAAHQLRTPLAVMRVEAGRALEAPHPPELHPGLSRLHAAAERSARLAQQLLSLARTEGAGRDPDRVRRPVDLAAVGAAAADRWLQPTLEAGQDLGFDLAPARAGGDALLLAEVIDNLVHNAVEHAGRGAVITVRTATEDGVALLCVEDDGKGPQDEDLSRLTQRFHRGPGAAGTGSGLGLAIVADIARLHGAALTVDRGPGGRGLKVTLRFVPPVSEAPAA